VARSATEIQAEIRLTRRAIEGHLNALDERTAFRRWAPFALASSAVLAGLALSRLPVLRVIRVALATMAAGVTALRLLESGRAAYETHIARNGGRQATPEAGTAPAPRARPG
jgi:hypothetical protein